MKHKIRFISLDNGLLIVQHQVIIRTNAGLLAVGLLRTYFSEVWRKWVWKCHLKNGSHFALASMSWCFMHLHCMIALSSDRSAAYYSCIQDVIKMVVTLISISVNQLPHWSWVTHKCINNQTIIGSDNSLSPDWRQAIIWTSAGILLIGPLGTKFSEILIAILTFSFIKMHWQSVVCKMTAILSQPHCVTGMSLFIS